jgi:hypothetical protein
MQSKSRTIGTFNTYVRRKVEDFVYSRNPCTFCTTITHQHRQPPRQRIHRVGTGHRTSRLPVPRRARKEGEQRHADSLSFASVSSQEEDKETSDDEGSEAGWNSEIIALDSIWHDLSPQNTELFVSGSPFMVGSLATNERMDQYYHRFTSRTTI